MRATSLKALKGAAFALMSFASLPAGPAHAQTAFAWPENPFAYTLPDAIFTPIEETRFEKAGRVFGDTLTGIPGELLDILTFPLTDPVTFGTFALGIGALTLIDTPTTKLFQQTVIPIGEKFDLPKPIKTPYITRDGQFIGGAILGTYAYGLAANDERAQVAALLASKAAVYSYLTSHVVLKAAFGRKRPVKDLNGPADPTGVFTKDPFDFFQGTGVHLDSNPLGTALPSFHFTLYFSTARVYSGVYDNYIIPYGVATALAVAAAENHNHWVSDMVAGALIGTGIGNMVMRNYEDRRTGLQGTVVPMVSSRGAGLGLQVSF